MTSNRNSTPLADPRDTRKEVAGILFPSTALVAAAARLAAVAAKAVVHENLYWSQRVELLSW